MTVSTTNAEATARDLKNNDHANRDLARLRKRLWRLSSLLTCGVLVIALVATWISSAVTAANGVSSTMSEAFTDADRDESVIDMRERTEPTVEDALAAVSDPINTLSDEHDTWRPAGSAPDSDYSMGEVSGRPFSVAVFDDGSVTFLRAPVNVIDDGGYDERREYWSETTIVSMVKEAIDTRAGAGPHLDGQYTQAAGMTWQWTTRVIAEKPEYDPSDPDESAQIAFYASGDLADYSKDGYLAARVFAFVDVSAVEKNLAHLALALLGAGAVGCILLVIVCRKIIDRALVPVEESQTRQREFLIKASHELKTPMASLSSNLDALMSNAGETVESQAQWTSNMREDIDELADRTCKLLDLVTQSGEAEDEPVEESDERDPVEKEAAGE